MKLSDFDALTFDCYGTLIDWESGIWNAMRSLCERAATPLDREPGLVLFARHESEQEAKTPAMPYSKLLAVVYARVASELGVKITTEEAAAFGNSVPDWPEFSDSVDALRYLKKHYKLVILSNVDRISFSASNARLGVVFDAIHTAEDIGSYKPSLRNFEYLLERMKSDFNLGPERILHTAQSLFHDHGPANRIGLASAWIDRRHAQSGWGATLPPPGTPRFDFRFGSMAEMAKAHQEEVI
jgi:2-haloacid dehalogenase